LFDVKIFLIFVLEKQTFIVMSKAWYITHAGEMHKKFILIFEGNASLEKLI
jgi:hypothetical protein